MFQTKVENDESRHDLKNDEGKSDYLKGYQHSIFEMKKQYNLRNRNFPITTNKTQRKKDVLKAIEPNKDPPPPPPAKEVEKATSTFSLENKISKIKIPIPFG